MLYKNLINKEYFGQNFSLPGDWKLKLSQQKCC